MTEQSSFDFQEDHQFLHIVQDGNVVDMSLEDVFDTDTYHTFKAVTFVASPKFFFEQTKHFQFVTLILGIEDGQMAENFGLSVAKLFDVEERVNMLKDLPEDVRNKIFDGQFNIRYPRNGEPVHSKIYLLEGDHTNRVIIGSANLTRRGFGTHHQYEELLIFDDSPLYDIYAQRFDFIYANTVDYIPEKIKQQRDIITDPDTLLDVLKEESLTLKTVVSEAQMNELKDMNHAHQQEAENLKKKRDIAELILQKSSQHNGYLVHEPAKLEKKKNPIRNVVLKQMKHTMEIDQRKEYIYDDKEDNILLSTPNETTWKTFSIEQPRDKVQEQFLLLLDFVQTFQTYSVDPSTEQVTQNMQRAFEVILYSFISLYIWRIRREQVLQEGSHTAKKDLFPFLIISGGSNSGKTTLLEFVSSLLGSPNQYYSHSQFRGKKTC